MPEYTMPVRSVAARRRWDGMTHILRGYLTAITFTLCDDTALDDLPEELIERAMSDLTSFVDLQYDDLRAAGAFASDGAAFLAGSDLWFTRNRHGCGYWDGSWPEPYATRLTDAAHKLGEVDVLLYGEEG